MKKASVLIIASVLLAALLCFAGCGSSSSDEGESSTSATSESSAGESSDSSSSEESASSESTASESNDDDSAEKSTTKKYTDKEIGLTVSLPSEWTSFSDEEIEEMTKAAGADDSTFLFFDFNGHNEASREYIRCQKFSGYGDMSVSDVSEEDMADFYSGTISVDSVKKKKLDSGTYVIAKGPALDGEPYYIIYEIFKNGYDIRYTYGSYGGKSDTPHLSDFEDMVNNAKYK